MTAVVYFYITALFTVLSAVGIVLAQKLYLAVISFFFLILFSSLLYFSLNAIYLSVFQISICGIFLVGYIWGLIKMMGRLALPLKLVSKPKIFFSVVFASLFAFFVSLFFISEFGNSIFDIFDFSKDISPDEISFSQNIFSWHLIVILLLISVAVVRVTFASIIQKNNDSLGNSSNNEDVN